MAKLNKETIAAMEKQLREQGMKPEPGPSTSEEQKVDINQIDKTRKERQETLQAAQSSLADALKSVGFAAEEGKHPDVVDAIKHIQNAMRFLARAHDMVDDFATRILVDMVNLYQNLALQTVNIDRVDQKAVIALLGLKRLGLTDQDMQQMFDEEVAPQYKKRAEELKREEEDGSCYREEPT